MANEGDEQAAAAWLAAGRCVDARCTEHNNATLLSAAAATGSLAIVRMLLTCDPRVNLADSMGWTALVGAAAEGHTTVVQVLLDAKADASLLTNGNNTALMWAERKGHTATAQVLSQHATRQTAEVMAKAAAAPPVSELRVLQAAGGPLEEVARAAAVVQKVVDVAAERAPAKAAAAERAAAEQAATAEAEARELEEVIAQSITSHAAERQRRAAIPAVTPPVAAPPPSLSQPNDGGWHGENKARVRVAKAEAKGRAEARAARISEVAKGAKICTQVEEQPYP